MAKIKVVHYVNQFFAQIGGEEHAFVTPELTPGVKGPGLQLSALLGDEYEIVATISCGDNYIAENTEAAVAKILEMVQQYKPQIFAAGPAFNAGRYGPACGVVCKAVGEALGIPCVTGMYKENPGVEMYRKNCYIVSTRDSAAGMKDALADMAALVKKLSRNEPLKSPEEERYFAMGFKRNVFVAKTGAERAVEMLLKKIKGEAFKTELSPPAFETVPPAAAVPDLRGALVALVTEGGITDIENKSALESARASKYLCFDISGMNTLSPNEFRTVHGGFENTIGNKDPNRIVPLDAARAFESEGRIGKLYDKLYTTTGNGTSLKNSMSFGQEIAAKMIRDGVQAVVLTST